MEGFIELGVIIGLTVLIAGIMKLLRQPLIIGYIITGIIVSPYFLNIIKSDETITIFSQMGIALLLFIVGLHLNPKVIKEVGKVSLLTGVGQILFTSVAGFLICRLLGFALVPSLYIAVALTFSSTIIIMKLLSDKKDIDKLYGKISIGYLLIQDLFAVLLLILIPIFSNGLDISSISFQTGLIALISIPILVLICIFALPKLAKFFAKSQEFLFLFSVGWGLGLAALFHYIGFSMEIGALIAGVTLSMSPYHYEISSRLKPLRDFFIIIFFILLGSQMVFADIGKLVIPIIVFSLFVFIFHPLIMMILVGRLGYKKKVGFQAGLASSQISEFSLIVLMFGVSMGHIGNDILSVVTLVGLITIAGSTYLISYSDKIYPHVAKYLKIFERKGKKRGERKIPNDHEAILLGYNRIGSDVLNSFRNLKRKFLVVDYNPDTVAELLKKKINCRYGDADDDEFLESLNLDNVKLVVSTIPDFDTNSLIINKVHQHNKDAIVIVISHSIKETELLYKQGASYVIMPHFLGGSYASMMINKHGLDMKKFILEKEAHLKYLRQKKKRGHEHPKVDKNH